MTAAAHVSAYCCATSAGVGRAALLDALRAERGGLVPYDDPIGAVETHVGPVAGLEAVAVPEALAAYDCRNNRLAELALAQDGFLDAVAAARARFGPARVGVVLGTSTSGIASTEDAYHHWGATGALPADYRFETTQELYALARYVARRCGLTGPSYTISAACASSTKTFVDAAQLLAADLCDAVLVGGVDTLCETSLRGFNSLQLLSPGPCRPNDRDRKGICIGEAGCFALMTRDPPEARDGGPAIRLAGYGESSDAHHMSAPHPEGLGARLAMRRALESAGLAPARVDYINMHGTGSLLNDRVEDHAIADIFGETVPCSSTKGWTGHTLGAAGGVEAVIAMLALEAGLIPGNLNLRTREAEARCHIPRETAAAPLTHVLTNNFGFGGNNCSLIFARDPDDAGGPT